MKTNPPPIYHARLHWLLSLAVVPGMAVIFLPFTDGVSPFRVLFDDGVFKGSYIEFWPLATPFFLAPLIAVACIRWIQSGWLPLTQKIVAYLAMAGTAGVTGWMGLMILIEALKAGTVFEKETFATIISWLILAIGVGIYLWNLRAGQPRRFNPVLALEVAYLANSGLCLIGFYPTWQSGAYCALLASLAYIVQIVVASSSRSELSAQSEDLASVA